MSLASINLWTRYSIVLEFKNRIVGGIPNDPNLIAGWIGANMPALKEEEKQKLVEATAAELPKMTEEKAEGMWTTFKKDKNGLYLEGRCIKAMFKESANVLRELLISHESKGRDAEAAAAEAADEAEEADEKDDKKKGKKDSRAVAKAKSRFTGLKAKVAERLFVEEDKVHIMKGEPKPLGEYVTKPDGNEEKPIHIMTALGPRTALKRFDYIEAPARIKFSVRHLNDKIIDLELLKVFFDYSSWNGLGADRSQGNGLFDVRSIDPLK